MGHARYRRLVRVAAVTSVRTSITPRLSHFCIKQNHMLSRKEGMEGMLSTSHVIVIVPRSRKGIDRWGASYPFSELFVRILPTCRKMDTLPRALSGCLLRQEAQSHLVDPINPKPLSTSGAISHVITSTLTMPASHPSGPASLCR